MFIAERTLRYSSETGDLQVKIEIASPERGQYGWRCIYAIGWPHERTVSEVWGMDPMQALILTFQKIGTDIYVSAYHKSGKLVWERSGEGYGFPVPKNGRDWLVGDDARFFG